MSGRKLLRKFSSSISDLLSLQKRDAIDEIESTTPLHHAVQIGNSIIVSNFVETKSIWIDEEDGKGRTALHYSMEQCNIEIASILLKGGANVDCVDFEGISACHIACKEGMIDHFNLLLYYHADICSIDKHGRTPFDLACEFGQEKMIDRLLTCGVRKECFFSATETHTASATHLAASNGHVQIVSRLLENGWDINRVTPQGTALHLASGFGTTQVVRFLLRAGINSSLKNANEQTAYEFAKKNAHRNPITYKEIRYLLKNCKSFVNGIATSEYCGNKADELSFSPGDKIWVIERNEGGHWKGIVFGQKGNSRSGYFRSNTVVINEEVEAQKLRSVSTPNLDSSMSSMSSRMVMPQNNQGTPLPGRHSAKPVPMPVIPHNASTFQSNGRNDYYMNSRAPLSSFGRAPSGMSDSSSDSHNGNRRMPSMTQSTFSSFGTDASTMLGGNRMVSTNSFKGQSSMFPSTSALPPMVGANGQNGAESHRVSTGSNSSHGSSGFESMKCSASSSSSFYLQNSLNESGVSDGHPCRVNANSTSSGSGSGSSSLASTSVHTLDDSFHSASTTALASNSVNVTQMVLNGVPPAEVLANWLDSISMSEYLSLLLRQGYELFSIARATPEDLLSLGIKNPDHRKKLIAEIHSWAIQDNWPNVVPIGGLREWLHSIALAEYITTFESQGYNTVEDILNLTWEDFEDIGVKRLGHLKRFGLAIKKIKDCRRSMANMSNISPVAPQNRPVRASPLLARSKTSGSRINDPPPPAPSSYFQPKMNMHDKIDYISYTRGSKCAPPPPVRQAVPVPLEKRRNVRSSYDALFAEDEPIRLNLTSTGKILSDISKMNKEKDQDFGYYDESEDCPPPPAPLYCEANPLRFIPLRSSMCSTGSTSSSEQIPFANENCGTIKSSRENHKFDFPTSLPPLLPVETNKDKRSAPSVVYDDLEEMMQNLCGDLLRSKMELSENDSSKKTATNVSEDN